MEKWISVSEKMPERRGDYLVATADGMVEESAYQPPWCDAENGLWYSYVREEQLFDEKEVTHWMELPQLPLGGND